MHEILTLLAQHITAAGFGGGALLIAAITCMPAKRPRSLDEFYAYVRDALQTAIPAGKRHPDPPPPGEPAQKSGERN